MSSFDIVDFNKSFLDTGDLLVGCLISTCFQPMILVFSIANPDSSFDRYKKVIL